MRWFEGSIPAAIASAKQQSFIFVVVITGEDELSAQLMSSWEDDKVSEAAKMCCVAIRVDAKSATCVQFSQIYPVVCVPSSFFIGENGIPLEVIAGSVSAEELLKRINQVKQMHAQHFSVPTKSPTSPPEPTPSPAAVTDAPGTSKESLSRTADRGFSGAITPTEDRSVSHSSQSEENLDAKVERLTKKLEERREQKKRGEEEGEIRKEMERRKLGKEILDLKKKQEEDMTKHLLEERSKEKAEEKAARDRVKQQIALDRADRAVRYAKNQEELQAAKQATQQARRAEQEASKEALARERSAMTRIQFRLPDGSSITSQFPSESRLHNARQFAVQEVGNRYGNFSLATMFPRREFTGEDLNRTLLELELTPSASMVLLPQSGRSANAVVQSSGEGVLAMLGTIFYPLLAVWRFLTGILFARPPSPGAAPRGPTQRPNSYPNSASSDEPKRETLHQRSSERRPDNFQKDGKVYRLRTQEDSEDDTNTWNGNSTQQM